ncbi:uncharacterized protein HMPREF1541_05114 [Cyphellophora europaea CBS 101466]|uniref:NAD+ kinase n=1 Tax=Cyphellophora europaea (strain CBS 101466) TaxID=1220924 RepID=W2RYS1_CYPE1|nr:uncharacterized protein HMPREF1541_05114 [Cyphellophora europaea CBS 101466]ETN40834.1 hypothetical protein HMPREF1541_05114 [Cyphellophora europaea CBS 101466]
MSITCLVSQLRSSLGHSCRTLWSSGTTLQARHSFSTHTRLLEVHAIDTLPPRRPVHYQERSNNDLLSLEWPSPPRNVLLIKKDCAPETTSALTEFASHINSTYPSTNIIVESSVADEVSAALPFPIYAAGSTTSPRVYHQHVDLITTFGGDGTILHAASLFATAAQVPPILSFGMGTLGFLGEWKFSEYKRAFREVYVSGALSERDSLIGGTTNTTRTGWSSVRGKSLGRSRGAKVLIRQRLQIGVFDANGQRLVESDNGDAESKGDMHAMNEVILHRGKDPHLAIVEVYVGGRYLTEAVADGMIISTPTGSTAYSLSSGGSIIHPLVPSLLLTPICPRSLSFRPLVLPAATPITLKLSEKNRGREVELSIDGRRRSHGIGVGAEVRVSGEELRKGDDNAWRGGIPCVLRQTRGGAEGDDGWVGGLNGLLKFNYPFGEES